MERFRITALAVVILAVIGAVVSVSMFAITKMAVVSTQTNRSTLGDMPNQPPIGVLVLIRVTDENGKPLSNHFGTLREVRSDGLSRIVNEVRTDGKGEIKLTQVPGVYSLDVTGAPRPFDIRLVGPYKQEFDIQVPVSVGILY
jgi:hypothetical protein